MACLTTSEPPSGNCTALLQCLNSFERLIGVSWHQLSEGLALGLSRGCILTTCVILAGPCVSWASLQSAAQLLASPKVALLFLTPGDMPLEEVSQLIPIADTSICWHLPACCSLAHDLPVCRHTQQWPFLLYHIFAVGSCAQARIFG